MKFSEQLEQRFATLEQLAANARSSDFGSVHDVLREAAIGADHVTEDGCANRFFGRVAGSQDVKLARSTWAIGGQELAHSVQTENSIGIG